MSRLFLVVLLLLAAGCSEPPQKEIDQALSAIDAARAAGADKYAADEYAGAQATLQKARASVEQRDYRQALSYALDARQRALEAGRLVPEARTRAQAAAETAFKSATGRAAELETLLRQAENAKVPAPELRAPHEALTTARASLQEARKLIDAGNFAEASAALPKVRENLDIAVETVQSNPQRPKAAKGKKR